MSIVKEERHKIELDVFNQRHEGGVRALHSWLNLRRDEVNTKWPSMLGEDLVRLQGEAGLIARLIRLIETGPTIKEVAHV